MCRDLFCTGFTLACDGRHFKRWLWASLLVTPCCRTPTQGEQVTLDELIVVLQEQRDDLVHGLDHDPDTIVPIVIRNTVLVIEAGTSKTLATVPVPLPLA